MRRFVERGNPGQFHDVLQTRQTPVKVADDGGFRGIRSRHNGLFLHQELTGRGHECRQTLGFEGDRSIAIVQLVNVMQGSGGREKGFQIVQGIPVVIVIVVRKGQEVRLVAGGSGSWFLGQSTLTVIAARSRSSSTVIVIVIQFVLERRLLGIEGHPVQLAQKGGQFQFVTFLPPFQILLQQKFGRSVPRQAERRRTQRVVTSATGPTVRVRMFGVCHDNEDAAAAAAAAAASSSWSWLLLMMVGPEDESVLESMTLSLMTR
mmetsp:Transcript_490/g.1383  ORF Transcript_490/g.1383 Transcript_490/m.1383 type:complete len:262 (+) Transcript_490:1691-2476(+)